MTDKASATQSTSGGGGGSGGVILRDLQSMLQRSLNDEKLSVVDCSVSRLVSIEESYGSVVLKIEAKVRGSNKKNVETLNLVGKVPNDSSDRPYFDWPKVLRKEVYVYSELMPIYRQLEREAKVGSTMELLPKYIGHRYSLDQTTNKVDENSIILIENLTPLNYYTCDRLTGMNEEHAVKALSGLARYHALGIALKCKKPHLFETAVEHARIVGLDYSQIKEGLDIVLRNFQDETFSEYLTVIRASFEEYKAGIVNPKEPEEPWATITHGDFWVKNVLFHSDENEAIDDVKFIDFQNYSYNSPLKELPQFFCLNVERFVRENCLNELIDAYYQSFTDQLKLLRIDTTPFSRDNFDEELKRQAVSEFPKCVLFLKFYVQDIKTNYAEDCSEFMLSVFRSNCSAAYVERAMSLIRLYQKKGWL